MVLRTRTERPQVIENSSATAMLGLEGMAVLAVSEGDGEVEYAIASTASTGWCPVCGAQARLHVGARRGCGICRRGIVR